MNPETLSAEEEAELLELRQALIQKRLQLEVQREATEQASKAKRNLNLKLTSSEKELLSNIGATDKMLEVLEPQNQTEVFSTVSTPEEGQPVRLGTIGRIAAHKRLNPSVLEFSSLGLSTTNMPDSDPKSQFIRKNCKKGQDPFSTATWYSALMFDWLNPIISITSELGEFDQDMHYPLRDQDKAIVVCSDFEANWIKVYPKGYVPPGTKTTVSGFFKVIWMTFKKEIILGIVVSILMSGLGYLSSFMIYKAIQFVSRVDESQASKPPGSSGKSNSNIATKISTYNDLGIYLVIMVSARMIMTVVRQSIGFKLSLLGIKIRNTLNLFIFRKVMRKSMERDTVFSMGEITNLSQVDSGKFSNLTSFGSKALMVPFEIIFGGIILWILMRNAIWPAFGIILLLLGVNIFLTRLFKRYQLLSMDAKDARGKVVNETFKNIRFVKMAALETFFLERMTSAKEEELKWHRKKVYRQLGSGLINTIGPALVMTTIYSFHLYLTGSLKIEDAFISAVVFGIFLGALRSLNQLFNRAIDIMVAAQRISFLLLSEEVDATVLDQLSQHRKSQSTQPLEPAGVAVEIKNGNFYWEDRIAAKWYKEEKDRVSDKKRKDKMRGKDNKRPDREDPQRSRLESSLSHSDSVMVSRRSSIKPRSNTNTSLNMSLLSNVEGSENTSVEVETAEPYTLVLRNVCLKVVRGSCVGVIGKVGSGKSSLLSSLLGDLYREPGSEVVIDGSIAYTSQKGWVTSRTIKENILFGEKLDEVRLAEAVTNSCMGEDIKLMEKGIETLLGDRGINLSGGQRMRLTLARAFYSKKDIYLFDDPISALDIHVGKKVMEDGILGYLKGTTRIIATHALGYLPYFDRIIVLKDGVIVADGTYDELVETEVFKEIQQNIAAGEQTSQGASQSEGGGKKKREKGDGSRGGGKKGGGGGRQKREEEPKQEEKDKQVQVFQPETQAIGDSPHDKLIQDIIQCEDKAKGSVDWSLYKTYLKMSGGYIQLVPLGIVLFLEIGLNFAASWFLQYWTTEEDNQRDIKRFVTFTLLIALASAGADFVRVFIFQMGNLRLGAKLNYLMSFRLLHASITKFFDRVPVGRILNRFLKDSDVVDKQLGAEIAYFLKTVFLCMLDLTVMVFTSTPIVVPFYFLYAYMSFRVQKRYQMLKRDITRLRAITSSPLIQCFSEGVQGNTTIRAFARSEYWLQEYLRAMDDAQKNNIVSDAASRWFNIRLALLSNLVIVPCLFMSVYVVGISAGMFALLLRYLTSTVSDIDNLLDSTADLENQLISFERCYLFCKLEPEQGYKYLPVLEDRIMRGDKLKMIKQVEGAWPQNGSIQLVDLKVKYRPDLEFVLRGLTLDIPHGSKVGIVGRTGAGKTTLISSIYRNFDEYEGQIMLSGRELRDIDLKVLRSNMTIIPQDPHIFQATLRVNLDPLEECPESTITLLLQDMGLWGRFERQKGLETLIEQGGSNLSQGERQLLCLARALLSGSKVVIMDEATANIDMETEVIIQRLLKERFKDCTVLMIAHRLNTILHCDRVLVLEKGRVLEYGETEALRAQPDSHFAQMLSKADELVRNLV